MTMVDTYSAGHESLLELYDLKTSYFSILKNSLADRSGWSIFNQFDKRANITLLCYALHTGNSGGCMGHFYDMTGTASGKAHWTVYSEGERGSLCEVMTAIQAALPEPSLSSRGSAGGRLRQRTRTTGVHLFSKREVSPHACTQGWQASEHKRCHVLAGSCGR